MMIKEYLISKLYEFKDKIERIPTEQDRIKQYRICSSSKQFCVEYGELLKEICDIKYTIGFTGKGAYTIDVHGKNSCRKIYNFLYGHENFCIKRKKDRFEKYINKGGGIIEECTDGQSEN
jgi:hypothetical protein